MASCSRSFPSTTSYNNRPSHRATDPPTARRPIVGPMQLTETELWPAAAGLVPMQPSDNHPPSCNRSDNQFSDLLQPPQSPNRPSHRGTHRERARARMAHKHTERERERTRAWHRAHTHTHTHREREREHGRDTHPRAALPQLGLPAALHHRRSARSRKARSHRHHCRWSPALPQRQRVGRTSSSLNWWHGHRGSKGLVGTLGGGGQTQRT